MLILSSKSILIQEKLFLDFSIEVLKKILLFRCGWKLGARYFILTVFVSLFSLHSEVTTHSTMIVTSELVVIH